MTQGTFLKNYKPFSICVFLLSALFLNSCGEFSSENNKSFHSDLLGTWVTNDPSLYSYSGTLKIDYETITIDGYEEDWLSVVGDDSKRPFKDFPKRVPLKGYSEDGKIFIDYGGNAQAIPYLYNKTDTYPTKYKILEFDFGGRKERLQCTADY
jgi:hypothetical protein